MASDPEHLPDAPQDEGQSRTFKSNALLFTRNTSYTSPYASNSSSSHPADHLLQSTLSRPPYRQPDFPGVFQPQAFPYAQPQALPYAHPNSAYRQPDFPGVGQPQALPYAHPNSAYRQPDFPGVAQPQALPYAHPNPAVPMAQLMYQHRSHPISGAELGQNPPSTNQYQSPYKSWPKPPQTPNANPTFPLQYDGMQGNGYHGQQMPQTPNVTFPLRDNGMQGNEYHGQEMGQLRGFTMPSRDAGLSNEEAGAQQLAMGRFSPRMRSFSPQMGTFHTGINDDQVLDDKIASVLNEEFIKKSLETDVAFDQDDDEDDDDESDSTESGSFAADEDEDDDDEDEDASGDDEVEEGSNHESEFPRYILGRGVDEVSDADTEFREHDRKMRGREMEILNLRRTMNKDSAADRKYKRMATAKVVSKGPRKIAELDGVMKMRLSRANQFYFQKNYSEARKEAQDIIRINAEVWQAYALLASIFQEWGQFDEELVAAVTCCHFKPKEEKGTSWLAVARRINEAAGESRQKHVADGAYCCSSALKTLKNNVEALCMKAGFNREMGKIKSAIIDYEAVLKEDPHNPKAMQGIALCHLDQDKPELARKIYEDAIKFYKESGLPDKNRFGWNEIRVYAELHAFADEYAEAIRHLKSLSRWIHGREEEDYWDEVTEDDREWDTDDKRRIEVASYQPDRYDTLTYGDGLPLDVRTKLGVYRLKLGNFEEALVHFDLIENEGQLSDDEGIAELADLFHEVGNSLHDAGYYREALKYYETLEDRVPNDEDFSHYLLMGKCYFEIAQPIVQPVNAEDPLLKKIEDSLITYLEIDENNIAVRQELIKFYDSIGDNDKAAEYRQEIKNLVKTATENYRLAEKQSEKSTKAFITRTERKTYRGKKKDRKENPNAAQERQIEEIRLADLEQSYQTLRRCNEGLKAGDSEATSEWMAAAADLVADFRTCKGIYPYDKYYYAQTLKDKESAMRNENEKAALDDDFDQEDTAARGLKEERKQRYQMPAEHLGIPWATWLDILMQYALCLSKDHRYLDAYDVCISAKEAVVYFHDQEAMFTIYLCWCICAVLANDMDTITSQTRHFMKEYQFVTDAYRLFATLVKLCQSPLSHLTKGPTTKFILRNIKAMDFSIFGKYRHPEEFSGRTSFLVDANGQPILAKDMDVCLLLLYGHILYVNTSFGKALHYLFRAYSLDQGNPMINMSVGLCYIQYAMKRQTGSRPYVIMQGISFMQNYYDNRKNAPKLEEREEAHYNMARTYHMLGLSHLAIPFYLKVLSEAELTGEEPGRDDLVVDAAYNLQTLYSVAGNAALAKAVTEKWLVI